MLQKVSCAIVKRFELFGLVNDENREIYLFGSHSAFNAADKFNKHDFYWYSFSPNSTMPFIHGSVCSAENFCGRVSRLFFT